MSPLLFFGVFFHISYSDYAPLFPLAHLKKIAFTYMYTFIVPSKMPPDFKLHLISIKVFEKHGCKVDSVNRPASYIEEQICLFVVNFRNIWDPPSLLEGTVEGEFKIEI